MRTFGALFAVFLLQVVVLGWGCASDVPATVTRRPGVPLKQNAKIFVMSVRQRTRIIESVKDAGFRTTNSREDSDYYLEVKVGRSRGTLSCGTINNIAYILRGAGGMSTVIKGRGATGSCAPNAFDDMSRKLASLPGS